MSRTHFTSMCALSLVLVAFHSSSALAKVWARVCLADEVTPLALADPNVPEVYRDIMVGTRLTIFITSDTAERWDGALWLSQDDWARGGLSARGYDQQSRSYRGSCLEAAGGNPRLTLTMDPHGLYFFLLSSRDSTPGEWFVLDYEAHAVGTCNIGLFAYGMGEDVVSGPNPFEEDPPPFEASLIQVLSFRHVPSRDFNGDTLVNFVDYASLAGLWGRNVVSEPNAPVATDLNADGRVDVQDVALFGEYWLERTEVVRPAPEPAEMDSMP